MPTELTEDTACIPITKSCFDIEVSLECRAEKGSELMNENSAHVSRNIAFSNKYDENDVHTT